MSGMSIADANVQEKNNVADNHRQLDNAIDNNHFPVSAFLGKNKATIITL